ncbi:MAG: M20/M25/M40 family metallo-hydrolase [Thermoleophilaceae bacterium]
MNGVAPPRAGARERERVVERFVGLCERESPSLHERALADAVTAELEALGLEVEEDASGRETGSSAGNLLARVPAPPGARTVLLCAHLDTVPLEAPVEVVEENGRLRNRHEAILGADNKAAIAVMLAAVARALSEGTRVGIELLFTTCEERALAGAKEFDLTRLRSEFGFVFDHASPIGELIVAAPTYYLVDAAFRGRAAHAGLSPELGHSAIEAAARGVAAIRFGRRDAETTANVGLIDGGSAPNVVAERCRVVCEARSLDHARAGATATEIVDAFTEAASDASCDLELNVEELFRGYRVPRSSPPAMVASAALADLGIEVRPRSTGGGSDANVFQARGFPCVNLANGTTGAHQPDEAVTVEALGTMLDVTLAILAHCAA